MTKIMFVGDVHLADTPPGYRTNTYRDDIFNKLVWLMNEANRLEVDLICLNGDIFHSRTRVSPKLLAAAIDTLACAHAPRLILPGNHDLAPGNQLESIWWQPTGILGRMKYTRIALEPYALEHVTIDPVPYVHDMPYGVCRFGFDRPEHPNPPRHKILWVHYAVTPRPAVYHSLVTDSNDWQPGAELIVCGHVHDDLGVWKDVHGNRVVNLGSISRGSLTEDNLERTPRVLLVTADYYEMKLQAIKLPVRPAGEVFRLQDKETEQAAERIAQDFIAGIGETKLAVVSVEGIIQSIRETDVSERVKDFCGEALGAST